MSFFNGEWFRPRVQVPWDTFQDDDEEDDANDEEDQSFAISCPRFSHAGLCSRHVSELRGRARAR